MSSETVAHRTGRVPMLLGAFLLSTLTSCDAPTASSGSAELAAIAEEVWQRQLETGVQVRIQEGLPIESLTRISLEKATEDAAFSRSVVERLESISAEELATEDRITLSALRHQADMNVEGLQHYWLITNVLTSYSSPLPGLRATFAALPIVSAADRAAFLALLRQVQTLVDEIEAHARGQMERGIVVSAANMDAVVGVVRGSVLPAQEGLFRISESRLTTAEELDPAFMEEVAAVVASDIDPALERLADFLDGEYRDAAPDGVGMSQYEGGAEGYRYLVRLHTTIDITPEEIHELGLELVASIEARMLELQQRIGFEGTIDDFRRAMPGNPDYFPETIDEVQERIESAANAFMERGEEWFAVMPELPFGARRLDPSLEATQTFGYYNPPTPQDPVGYYNFNGSNLDQRNWLTYAGLAYHELFPGHHYQIGRQRSNEAVPAVRRNTNHTAYTEGWGSYSTYLGIESGLLADDPLSEYGAYMMEVFLATRLVVDTGMNGLGWSLEDGREYMRAHVFESDQQIFTESLRYSTDLPGQALGYQMGKQELLRLRERAEAALGDRFDLRRFHEAILSPGSLPMTVLGSHIDAFIESEAAGG